MKKQNTESSGLEDLEKMISDIESEEALIIGEAATMEQEAVAERLASDDQRAADMAGKLMEYLDGGLKFLDPRLSVDPVMVERARGNLGLKPVILKHRLFELGEDFEPPPWMVYLTAAAFLGVVGFNTYLQLQMIKAMDAEQAENEKRKPGTPE
jgi:hypothetical protein